MADSRKDSRGRVLKSGESERKDGSYCYRWTFNGKRQTIYAATLKELREKEKQVQSDLINGIDTNGGNITLNKLFEQSMKLKSNDLKVSTLSNYVRMWNNNIKDSFIGNKKIGDIKPLHIKQFYSDCQAKGMKKSTIKLLHTLIISSFELAVENDYIRKNPAKDGMRGMREDAKEKIPLSSEQVDSLIKFCQNSNVYSVHVPFLIIALGTGMRCGEICGLTWNDIDLENNTISINHQLIYKNVDGTGCKFYITTPKTDAGAREVPMTEAVHKAFIELKKQHLLLGVTSRANIDGYSNFVFISKNGNPFAPNAVNNFLLGIENAYNKAYPQNKIPHLSAHILRHTACTLYATAKMDIKALQSLMGHKNANVTMNVYNHSNYERTEKEIQRLGNVINF